MMQDAGLIDVRFADRAPYWCAVGTKSPNLSDEPGTCTYLPSRASGTRFELC